MNDPESFLQRWSRRKLNPEAPASAEPPPQQDSGDGAVAAVPAQQADPATGQDPAEPYDPASLPPIDSLGADSDITAFLRPGVPPDLTRAALRKAWTSDPAIRDFVGLVENGWDFNNPDAMGGFGAISADEVARLASRLFAQLPDPASADSAAKQTPGEENVLLRQQPDVDISASDDAAEKPAADGAIDAPQNNSDG